MTTPSKTKTKTATKTHSHQKTLTPEARYLKIQEEAYCHAEKDGFKKHAVEYWLAAETKIGA